VGHFLAAASFGRTQTQSVCGLLGEQPQPMQSGQVQLRILSEPLASDQSDSWDHSGKELRAHSAQVS